MSHARESRFEDILAGKSYDQFAFLGRSLWAQDMENRLEKGKNGGRTHLAVIWRRNDES